MTSWPNISRSSFESSSWAAIVLRSLVDAAARDARIGMYRDRLGGFNWWSQRLTLRGCYAEEKPGVESCRCSRNALGWASACGAAGASGAVLGGDRSRGVKREGCGRGGCVAEHWCPVVPQGWRDAASRARARVGALSVVHRAGGDRGSARAWLWGARDRASARPCAVDDLPRVATQCGDRTWPR